MALESFCKTFAMLFLSVLLVIVSPLAFASPTTVTMISGSQASFPVPTGVVSYVPITLSNDQSSATPNNFQQNLTVNWSSYASYVNSSVSNVEFFDASGKTLNAWCEIGYSPSVGATGCYNNVTSTVWVNLGSNVVPANGELTIYLGFLPISTNNMGNSIISVWGESPYLSEYSPSNTVIGTYGQYDDGANVFGFYDNFAGTSLSSKWTVTGGVTPIVNDSVVIPGSSGGWGMIYAGYPTSGSGIIDAGLGELPSVEANGTQNSSVTQAAEIGFSQSSSTSATIGQNPELSHLFAWNGGGAGQTGIWTCSTVSCNLLNSYHNFCCHHFEMSAYWNTPNLELSAQTFIGASIERISATDPSYNSSSFVWAGSYGAGTRWMYGPWYRIRAYPPNGVMPTATFSSLTSTPSGVPSGGLSNIIGTLSQTTLLLTGVIIVLAVLLTVVTLRRPKSAGPAIGAGVRADVIYCRQCGTQNPAAHKFCEKCGAKL